MNSANIPEKYRIAIEVIEKRLSEISVLDPDAQDELKSLLNMLNEIRNRIYALSV